MQYCQRSHYSPFYHHGLQDCPCLSSLTNTHCMEIFILPPLNCHQNVELPAFVQIALFICLTLHIAYVKVEVPTIFFINVMFRLVFPIHHHHYHHQPYQGNQNQQHPDPEVSSHSDLLHLKHFDGFHILVTEFGLRHV